jgi:signal transduction histidine kinase
LFAVAYFLNRARKKAYLRMLAEKQSVEALLREKEQLLDDLHLAQQQLIQHEKMASLGQLTAGIAHELNNPLNFILNNLDALRMDYAELKQNPDLSADAVQEIETEMTQLLADIEHGGHRMRHIVQELRQFSRADTGEMEQVDLGEAIQESIRIAAAAAGTAWPVELELPDKLPTIQGYSGKLVQLFSNLIANAFDALDERWGSQAGQGKLLIAGTFTSQRVVIRFSDNGNGMSAATRMRLFDPFYTTKPVGKGTGLGLSIAFAIVKVHKGHIEVDSEPEMGTTFTIEFERNHTAVQ